MCKRPLSNNDYYQTFNRPNVKLVDVSPTQGLEAMTEKGFIARGVEHEIDCIVFASGFEVTSDLKRRWGFDRVEGRNGVSIYDHWADGPKTLHGMMTHNFPNMFFTGYVQGAANSSTTLVSSDKQCEHIAYIVQRGAQARRRRESSPARGRWTPTSRTCRENEFDTAGFLGGMHPRLLQQ